MTIKTLVVKLGAVAVLTAAVALSPAMAAQDGAAADPAPCKPVKAAAAGPIGLDPNSPVSELNKMCKQNLAFCSKSDDVASGLIGVSLPCVPVDSVVDGESARTVGELVEKGGDRSELSCCTKQIESGSEVNSGLLGGGLSNLLGGSGVGLFDQCSKIQVAGAGR